MHKTEGSAAKIIQNGQAHPERQVEIEKSVIPRKTSEDAIKIPPKLSGSKGVSVPVHTTLQRDASDATSVALLVKESIAKFCSYLRSQPHLPLLLVVSFAMILLLMQVCDNQFERLYFLENTPCAIALVHQPLGHSTGFLCQCTDCTSYMLGYGATSWAPTPQYQFHGLNISM